MNGDPVLGAASGTWTREAARGWISGLHDDVTALFNWGRNRRWGELEEEREKTYTVRFQELGLNPLREYLVYEFWTGRFVGTFQESFSDTLPA